MSILQILNSNIRFICNIIIINSKMSKNNKKDQEIQI